MNKKLLVISGGLTAFVLAVLVGIFSVAANESDTIRGVSPSSLSENLLNTLGIKTQAQLNAQTQASLIAVDEGVSQALPVFDLIEQVTSKLPLIEVATHLNTPVTTNESNNGIVNDDTTLPAGLISAQQAREIAQHIAPNTIVTAVPELVNYSGRMAYEVVMGTGLVYVDASSGVILDNGAVASSTRAYEDDEEHGYKDKLKKSRREKEDDDDDDEHHRG